MKLEGEGNFSAFLKSSHSWFLYFEMREKGRNLLVLKLLSRSAIYLLFCRKSPSKNFSQCVFFAPQVMECPT